MHGGPVAFDYLGVLLVDLGRRDEELHDVHNGRKDDEEQGKDGDSLDPLDLALEDRKLTVVLGDFFSRWLHRCCCLDIRPCRRHQVHADILDSLGVSGPILAIHRELLSTPQNTWPKLAVRSRSEVEIYPGFGLHMGGRTSHGFPRPASQFIETLSGFEPPTQFGRVSQEESWT